MQEKQNLKRQKPASPAVSFRLDPELVARIDAANESRHKLMFPGHNVHRPETPSRTAIVRFLLEEGLRALEKRTAEIEATLKKGGAR